MVNGRKSDWNCISTHTLRTFYESSKNTKTIETPTSLTNPPRKSPSLPQTFPSHGPGMPTWPARFPVPNQHIFWGIIIMITPSRAGQAFWPPRNYPIFQTSLPPRIEYLCLCVEKDCIGTMMPSGILFWISLWRYIPLIRIFFMYKTRWITGLILLESFFFSRSWHFFKLSMLLFFLHFDMCF